MAERVLSQVQAAGMVFTKSSTAWHFATKWAAVRSIKPWMSSLFSE